MCYSGGTKLKSMVKSKRAIRENFSTELFHEVLNPLTVVSLQLDALQGGKKVDFGHLNMHLDKIIHSLRHLEYFVRLLLETNSLPSLVFSPDKEIRQVIDIVTYRAHKAGVQIIYQKKFIPHLRGDVLLFHQLIMKIVTHFIPVSPENQELKKLDITLTEKKQTLVISLSGREPESFSEVQVSEILRTLRKQFGGTMEISFPRNVKKYILKFPLSGKQTSKP